MDNLIHGGDIYSRKNNKTEFILDFSANINPFGMPASVKEAIVDNINCYSNYPDPLCRELRKAIAHYEKISSEYILCGNGAADLIFKISLALKPKKGLIIAPTFAEYEQSLNLVDCDIRYYNVNEKDDFYIKQDILNYITPELDIMFICNPNNPTGIPLIKADMINIINKCRDNNVIVVVDECFIDFLVNEEEYSVSAELKSNDRLIILKAFTKIYAMAGIRLGYLMCSNTNIIDKIASIGQPWSVSTVAIKCGIAALTEKEYVTKTKEYINQNREYLISELKKLGYRVFNSEANYVLFSTKNISIKQKLEERGILIRSCSNYRNLNDSFFRIAVKSRENNIYLINCLKEIEGHSE